MLRPTPRYTLPIALLTIIVASSCGDGVPTAPVGQEQPPPAPQFAISDAAHGGNSHFLWLPPLVGDPGSFNGDFDDSQTPIVEICEWNGSACVLPLLATYSMTSGVGSEVVRMEAADEHYIVNWHTDEFTVSSDVTYRIRLLVSGTLLGLADIEFAATGKEAKNLSTDHTIGFKDGRTLPIKFRIEEGAVFVVPAADGGTVEALAGAVVLDIPPAALPGDVGITVESVPPVDDQLAIVEFGPPMQFAEPVPVTLGYDPAALPPGIAEEDLALNLLVNGERLVMEGSTVDVNANTVTAPFHHFSQGSVGPAKKAVACPGDNNPNTFESIQDAIDAVMAGGTVEICDGTHTVVLVQISKALTIEGKPGSRPTLTTGGARYGLVTSFTAGTLTIRNLRLETDLDAQSNDSYASALLIQSSHDQVVVEDVDLDVLPGLNGAVPGSGVLISQSSVPGAHVTIRNVTQTGGRNGVFVTTRPNAGVGASVEIRDASFSSQRGILVYDESVNSALGAISDVDIDNVTVNAGLGVFALRANSGVGARVDVTNSSFSGGALLYRNGASGLIQGNTIACGPVAACIQVGSDPSSSSPEPVRVIGNQLSAAPGATHDAIWLTQLDTGPFEVRNNQVNGTFAGGSRSDPLNYSFNGHGIRLDGIEAPGDVSGNSIAGAFIAVGTEGGSVKMAAEDNIVSTVWTGVRVANGGQMSFYSSDLTDYIVPIDPAEPFGAGDLTCNWWGNPAGPQGLDPGILASVYTPWAVVPVAGTSTTGC